MKDQITKFRGPYWFLNLYYPIELTTTLRVNDEPHTLTFKSAGHLLAACKSYHFRKGVPAPLKLEYVLAVQRAKSKADVEQLSNAAPVFDHVWSRFYLGWLRKIQELKFLGGFDNDLIYHLLKTEDTPINGDPLESIVLDDLRKKIKDLLLEELDTGEESVL